VIVPQEVERKEVESALRLQAMCKALAKPAGTELDIVSPTLENMVAATQEYAEGDGTPTMTLTNDFMETGGRPGGSGEVVAVCKEDLEAAITKLENDIDEIVDGLKDARAIDADAFTVDIFRGQMKAKQESLKKCYELLENITEAKAEHEDGQGFGALLAGPRDWSEAASSGPSELQEMAGAPNVSEPQQGAQAPQAAKEIQGLSIVAQLSALAVELARTKKAEADARALRKIEEQAAKAKAKADQHEKKVMEAEVRNG
jgi:hypothetical protein